MSKPAASLPALRGWSATMKRWLASTTDVSDPAVRWTATIDDVHGPVQIWLDKIRAIRVEDLAQVLEHRIAAVEGSRLHLIRFAGGGELRFTVDGRGEFVELRATGVKGSLALDGILTFGALVSTVAER